MNVSISGHHLKLARILYGYDTQEKLAQEMEVSVATIQRYEAEKEVDVKILAQYVMKLNFDLERVIHFMDSLKQDRQQSLTIKSM